ncbi:hypothetical protein DBO86_12955 [Pseudomonas indoloxydans]|uniref:Uncharacterized protein n=1 Tax=Ectopseudomonas oleovorans TaxID=301 RepID=A0A2T5PLQ6_ECTOL|nr:hypothetical protein DBO86_12955 [Pseudomonas indoloxydans]
MSILIGLAHEPVFNAAMATQVVFQQPASAKVAQRRLPKCSSPSGRRWREAPDEGRHAAQAFIIRDVSHRMTVRATGSGRLMQAHVE